MTIHTTNYTTYDLAYYYADLRRLPRLSREERQGLVTGLSESPPSPALSQDDTHVKHRLIEGYLPLAKHLAITFCPPALYQRLLEDTLYTLFYEDYRGYTIYSTPEGRCCIYGKHGCIKLRGKFLCFPDFEDAKTLIKRFRAEGYTSSEPVERYVPEWEYVYLNRHEQQRASTLSYAMQRVS